MIEILTGIIAGSVSGLGMGGGTILILMLSNFLGLEQHIAQASNLIFFIPTAITATIINFKQKLIDVKFSIFIILGGLIGVIIGEMEQYYSHEDILECFYYLYQFAKFIG